MIHVVLHHWRQRWRFAAAQQRHTPTVHTVQKNVETPQAQVPDKQNRTLNVPLPQIQEEIVDVIQFVSQGRISECIFEQTVDVSFLQIREPSVEVTKVIPQERLQSRTVEQGVQTTFAVQHQ